MGEAHPVEESENPLLLTPIINNIMCYLSNRDLMTSRLVCKDWNKGACIMLRQTKTIKLRLKPEILADYTQIMESSLDFPYAQYELEFYHMADDVVEDFVRVCGPYITSLQLNNCRSTVPKLWDLLQTLRQTLTSFAINCDPIEEDGNSRPPVTLPVLKSLHLCGEFCLNRGLLQDLMQASGIQLESLFLRCYDHTLTDSPFENLCFQIFCDPAVSFGEGLQQFRMETRLSESQVESFTRRGCRALRSLYINLERSVRVGTLVKFLGSLSETLVNMELNFEPEPDTGESCAKKPRLENEVNAGSDEDSGLEVRSPNLKQYYALPNMAALQRLTLTNYKGSLRFMNGCKSLKYLTLANSDEAQETLPEVEEHRNLRSFVSSTPLDKNSIHVVASLFPNLKTLNVILDDPVLAIVFQVMPNLEELILAGTKVTDEGVTGIENIFEMMTIYGSMEDMSGQLEEQIPELRKLPYIGNLRNLRRVQIHNAGFISDASVIYGLVSCKNLVEISLLNAEVTDISLDIIGRKLERLKKLEILCNIPKLTPKGKALIRTQLPECDFILGQTDLMNLYRPPRQFNGGQMDLLLDLFID